MSPVDTPQKNHWAGLDSNQRRLAPMGLQPIPFIHSGTDPHTFVSAKSNTKKHASANLRLLYPSEADIARKLGGNYRRLHISAGCDINSSLICGE
jgi:hypothetical protein